MLELFKMSLEFLIFSCVVCESRVSVEFLHHQLELLLILWTQVSWCRNVLHFRQRLSSRYLNILLKHLIYISHLGWIQISKREFNFLLLNWGIKFFGFFNYLLQTSLRFAFVFVVKLKTLLFLFLLVVLGFFIFN